MRKNSRETLNYITANNIVTRENLSNGKLNYNVMG
jgi:hypothetical protein